MKSEHLSCCCDEGGEALCCPFHNREPIACPIGCAVSVTQRSPEQPEPVAEVCYTDARFIRWRGHMKHGRMSLPDGMKLYAGSDLDRLLGDLYVAKGGAEMLKAERDALRAECSAREAMNDEQRATINQLRAKVRGLEADAARYRWLRDAPATQESEPIRNWLWTRPFGADMGCLDAAIDKAMQEGKP